MKRSWFVYALMVLPAITVSIASIAMAQTNYSGTWVLDKEKTAARLPHLQSYTMVVVQDEEQLTVQTIITGDKKAQRRDRTDTGEATRSGPVSRPRGGPGPFGMVLPTATYKLDGTTTTVEQGRSQVSLKAEWKENQTVLKLSQTRRMSMPDGEFSFTTVERWELAPDGATLTVHRTSESPRGTHTSTFVFKRSEPLSR